MSRRHEFLEKYNPSYTAFPCRENYPKDSFGDHYIPLSEAVRQPLPFDQKHPGRGIMVHLMNEHPEQGSLETLSKKIIREGFLTPRRYATFHHAPWDWVHSEHCAVLVYRSFTQWTKEFNLDTHSRWAESSIGVSAEQAMELCPDAVAFHKKNKAGQSSFRWDFWGYIPPQHLLGIAFFGKKFAKDFHTTIKNLTDLYKQGKVDELEVAFQMSQKYWSVQLFNSHEMELTDAEKVSFWLSYCAAFTEHSLMEMIHTNFQVQSIAGLQPSYEHTQHLQQAALQLLP